MDIILLILCIIIVLIVLLNNFEINNFKVTKYTVKTDKICQSIKIAVLSDLHNRKYDYNNLSIYGAIDSMAPNVVFIAGDMINRGNNLHCENVIPLIKKIASKYKVIYVFGNHEQKMKDRLDEYVKELKDSGVLFLSNNSIEEQGINIFGIEIGEDFYRKLADKPMEDDYVSGILGKPKSSAYNVLIAHNPVYFRKYAEWGADLVISGHMHGGVINLPFLRGIISPQMVFFPKYSVGEYDYLNSKLLVSRGIGSHTVNLRIFNRPEIVLVEIVM